MNEPFESEVESHIVDFSNTGVKRRLDQIGLANLAIKYVNSRWARQYTSHQPIKISESVNMTWGTGTYVAPLIYPQSTVMYGRIGIVSDFNPQGWRVFDATNYPSVMTYLQWAQSQPIFEEVLTTVHSLEANAILRNTFRERFRINCILFYPDQSGHSYTGTTDTWMCVSDFDSTGRLQTNFSSELANALFSVLVDEDFEDLGNGLNPKRSVNSLIEQATLGRASQCLGRTVPDSRLAQEIASLYAKDGFLHYYIQP